MLPFNKLLYNMIIYDLERQILNPSGQVLKPCYLHYNMDID